MMFIHEPADIYYCETDEMQMVQLPYKGGVLGMHIILPRKHIPMSEFLDKHLSEEKFASWKSILSKRDLDLLAIPKFKFEYFIKLNEML